MVITEQVIIKNKTFNKSYSDNNTYIRKVGTEELYIEAIDVLSSNYIYEETDLQIEQEGEE